MANKNKRSSAINSGNAKVAGAGILGAVIGAAVGAGAVALSSKKNQKFLKSKFNEYKGKGQKIYSDLQNKVQELSTEGKKKIKEVKKTLKKKT